MTDPLDSNDDWADLAREFNLDKPSAPPPPAHEAVEPHHDPRAEDAAPADGEMELEAAEDESDDGEDAPAGEAGADGDQTGTGRKRRRRRRRRRKGGAPADGAAAETDADGTVETEAETEAEAETETDAEPVVVAAEESDGYAEDEGDETDAAPLAAEEDTASDVLRELIATWNVPSWGEIVDGLYRPH